MSSIVDQLRDCKEEEKKKKMTFNSSYKISTPDKYNKSIPKHWYLNKKRQILSNGKTSYSGISLSIVKFKHLNRMSIPETRQLRLQGKVVLI